MRTRLICAAALAAIALTVTAGQAHADLSKKVQRALRGKLIITEEPLVTSAEGSDKEVIAGIKKASLPQLKHTKDADGIAGWRFNFIAFMKKAPKATQLTIDFYTNDREKLYVANKRLSGIDPKLTLLQGRIDITEDDGVKVGGSYVVKLAATKNGRDVILATVKLVLK